jgi:hypothetical protein
MRYGITAVWTIPGSALAIGTFSKTEANKFGRVIAQTDNLVAATVVVVATATVIVPSAAITVTTAIAVLTASVVVVFLGVLLWWLCRFILGTLV